MHIALMHSLGYSDIFILNMDLANRQKTGYLREGIPDLLTSLAAKELDIAHVPCYPAERLLARRYLMIFSDYNENREL